MRRAFKSVFYIRGNYVNKEGKSAIMIRICLDGNRINVGTTGICVDPEKWDTKRQQLRGRSTEVYHVNKQLDGIRNELDAISEKLDSEDKLSLEAVKMVYQGIDEDYNTIGKLFNKYISNVIEKTGVTLSKTSYSKYALCRQRFMDMLEKKHHCKDMPLTELNPTIIEDFYIYLTSEVGHCNNTAVKTMKTLRTVILHGIKMGVLHSDPYLGVHLHMDKVDRGFLTENEIEALMTKHFDIDRIELVRDLFVFSCFTGLAYIDVKALMPKDICKLNNTDWIMTKRVKTSTPVNVVLFKGAKLIIDKYKDAPKKKGHVFPVISNQKTNQYLKEIATACGINKELTFHMARHTFATLTLSKGVPIESVSRMLGHTNIKTTQIYARITNKKIEEDMAKFFKDKTITNFGKESEDMTAQDKEEPETKIRKKKYGGRTSARV